MSISLLKKCLGLLALLIILSATARRKNMQQSFMTPPEALHIDVATISDVRWKETGTGKR